ncbi:MAG: ROK family protein [Candidatus Omnitrophota bacterium]
MNKINLFPLPGEGNNGKRTADRDSMKDWNTRLVLSLIRNQSNISQAEISRKTGLSPGTIVNVTRRLKEQGVIKAAGQGKSGIGRPPVILRFNPKTRYVISAAFFALETKIAILDLEGNIQKKISYPTRPEKGRKSVFQNFRKQTEHLLSQLSIPKEKICALCASFEGIVDSQIGSLVYSAHLKWRNLPVKSILEKTMGLPTFVDNEGRAMALAEYWFGMGKPSRHMVTVDIDAGIGSATILDGRLLYGTHQMEGEIGHTLVLPDGPLCRCGRRGCLETISSGSAILRRVRESLPKISDLPERQVMKMVFQEAKKGDGVAFQVIRDASYHLGRAIAGIVNYADPDMVVLTGYVAEADPGILLTLIQKEFRQAVFKDKRRKIEIVKGKLGENAVLIGNACLAYQEMFSLPGGG